MKRMLLPLNLQYFAEPDAGGGAGEGDKGGSGDWIDDFYADNKKDENMIPKSRFDSINTKYKELLDATKTKDTEYADLVKKLEDADGSSKTLQETIDAGTQRIEALEGLIQGMLESELEQIDEEYHELVPKDKPIEEQLDWLRKAKAKGLFGSKGYEFEIGQPSNPRGRQGSTRTEGMNPIQLLTMGYGSK